jgi:hypothetical protein
MSESIEKEKAKQIGKTAAKAGIIIRLPRNKRDQLYHCLDVFEAQRKRVEGVIGKNTSYQKRIEAVIEAFVEDAQRPSEKQVICPQVSKLLTSDAQ